MPHPNAAVASAANQDGPVIRKEIIKTPLFPTDDLKDVIDYDAISPVPFIDGMAYLQLHDGPHAAACFLRTTKYRGSSFITGQQTYALAQLGLARACILTGDQASARKSYEALFVTWKSADADLPQLVAAEKEYGALK